MRSAYRGRFADWGDAWQVDDADETDHLRGPTPLGELAAHGAGRGADGASRLDAGRDVLVDADIAVAPLEHPLTANEELTPCVETVVFTGSHRAVPAMANAGLDVVLTVGNHPHWVQAIEHFGDPMVA